MLPAQLSLSATQLNNLEPGSQNLQTKLLLQEEAALQATQQTASDPTVTTTGSALPSDTFSILKNSRFDLADFLAAENTPAAPASDPSSGGLNGFSDKIGSLSGQLQDDMTKMQNLDPNSPTYLQDSTKLLTEIQNIQNQIQEMTTLLSNEMSFEHQTQMAIINNLKG